MSGELDLDVEALVAKDLLCFADDGICELGMEVMSSGEFVLRAGLNNSNMDSLIRIDRP